MMKKLTKRWLIKYNACEEAVDEFLAQKETDVIKILKVLIKQDKLEWANWLVTWQMGYKGYVSYAIYAAKQVLGIFEKVFPYDDSPRKAIEAAEKCLKSLTIENKSAVYVAAKNAYNSAKNAYRVAKSTKNTNVAKKVYGAGYSAESSVYAAYSAEGSMCVVEENAYNSAKNAYGAEYGAKSAESKKMRKKILRYGIKLLEEYNE